MILRNQNQKTEEPLDRNKTPLTHKLTALASAYFDGLGCKPIETEVSMPDGTIADIGTFVYPTMTELRIGKFLKRIITDEVRDTLKDELFNHRYGRVFTIAAEVKITKEDFKKDLGRKYDYNKSMRNPVSFFYLIVPYSLKEEAEKMSRYVGIILCSDNGDRILKVEPPWYVNPLHPYEIIDFIAQVAIRRDHRTRYAAMRALLKSYRAENV